MLTNETMNFEALLENTTNAPLSAVNVAVMDGTATNVIAVITLEEFSRVAKSQNIWFCNFSASTELDFHLCVYNKDNLLDMVEDLRHQTQRKES